MKKTSKYFWVDNPNQKKKKNQRLFDYKNKASFYSSKAWRTLRLEVLAENPLCVECLKQEKIVGATEVDHVIPISEEPLKALDYDNLQPLCHGCHVEKTREENRQRKQPDRQQNKNRGKIVGSKWIK